MAKFDQGGGCPCGLKKVCDCEYENSKTITIPYTFIENMILPWLQAKYGAKVEIVRTPVLQIHIRNFE